MTKLFIILSVIILWVHFLFSAILNIYLEPFAVEPDFFFYASWVLLIPVGIVYFNKLDVNYIVSPYEKWKEDDEFEQKVIDLEYFYKDNVQALKRKTLFLTLLCYFMIFGIIAFVLFIGLYLSYVSGLYLPLGYWKYLLALPYIYLSFKMFKSMFLRGYDYKGVEVTKKQCPRLFALLNKIQYRAEGPKFKKVFIDMEFNASVSRHRGFLGTMGFGKVTLNLGLPLMQCLNVKQLAAIVAHEYGHVAARDNNIAQWIYRVRQSWLELDAAFNREKLWILFLGKLYERIFYQFRIYSFVLSRYCEYEADKFAANIVGKQNISEALTLTEFFIERLNKEYWAEIWKKTKELPKPSLAPYAHLKEKMQNVELSKERLLRLMGEEEHYKYTHPVLIKRLTAIGRKVYEIEIPNKASSEEVLGEGLENSLTFMFDKAWRNTVAESWSEMYNKYQQSLVFMNKFSIKNIKKYSMEQLKEAMKQASIAEDSEAMLVICNEVLSRDEKNPYAKLNLYGYFLINENKVENLVKLDELVAEYPEYLEPACYFAIKYLEKNEWYQEAKIYRYRLEDWEYKRQSADAERNYIFVDDVLIPQAISKNILRDITMILSTSPAITKAWIVAKETKYFKTTTFFPIILQKSIFSFKSKDKIKQELDNLLIKQGLGAHFRCFWLDEVRGRKSRIKEVHNSLIYRKYG